MGALDSVRRGLLLAVALVAALAMTTATAGAVEIGISDSDEETLAEPYWNGLNVNRVRVVLPYDVATAPERSAGARRRARFERYLAAAAPKGVDVMVAFSASQEVRAPGSGYPVAPTADQFAAGFAAFRARYPQVRTIAPWNEPNNVDARQYPLSGDPALAAQYWLRAKAICPTDCLLVAGDFAGIPGDDAYVDAYQAALGDARPDVWAFHAHSDINAFQAGGPDSARISRYYLSKFQGPWANARIWIDEIGARFRAPDGVVWGDASQAQATSFLLGLATLDPRIDAIYYYNYSNRCAMPIRCAQQDRGLVSPSPIDGNPPEYDGYNRPRQAWQVIAGRGPVIPPAAPVPPVVTIDQPAQAAALNTPAPTFAGGAAVGGRAEAAVTVQVFPGTGADEGAVPVQAASGPVGGDGRWAARTGALADGVYTARAQQVGNPSSSGISQDTVFTIDTVAPTSTATTVPPAQTGARSATVVVAASEAGSTFTCSLNRAKATPCGPTIRLRRLPIGTHVLRIRAVDPAGNVQSTPTVVKWRVVSLATALVPRSADLRTATGSGLPLRASCADACRVVARLYMPRRAAIAAGFVRKRVSRSDPARPRGGDYVVVAGKSLTRKRGGSASLALKVRTGSGGARVSSAEVRVGLVLRPQGSKATVVSRRVTLARSGPLRSVAARGLPVTVACSSACSAPVALWAPQSLARSLRVPGRAVAGSRRNGLPRGRYVALGRTTIRRTRGGGSDPSLTVPRAVRSRLSVRASAGLRVTAKASGPGTPARWLSWPLTLPR
ncbi:hypothetical protein [Conexibacter arvalis]|uniref:Uncharacterized protein n=1 Tax=Conexibacter arvalis TaxID=912552 RepID=A0A840IDF0_9ACTN|nr:hypothetical protein [Conexibacter arvalis]MBB4662792.1 hypothetical protein [Conexibacter arvalis]